MQEAADPRCQARSIGSGQRKGKALLLNRKCCTERQQRSTRVYPLRSVRRQRSDANLTVQARTEDMNGQEVPRHEVTEREVASRTYRNRSTTAYLYCRSCHGRQWRNRVCQRGLRCTGGPGLLQQWTRAEMLAEAGYGARESSQVEEACERK
jgi:hypothetical protein